MNFRFIYYKGGSDVQKPKSYISMEVLKILQPLTLLSCTYLLLSGDVSNQVDNSVGVAHLVIVLKENKLVSDRGILGAKNLPKKQA